MSMISEKMYNKTKVLRGYLTKLGQPFGPYLDWTENPALTKEENDLLNLAWRRYKNGGISPNLKTAIKIEECYKRVFPEAL